MTFKIALLNIFRHRVRSLITLSTIVFGCVALIFVGGFFEDVFQKSREGYIGSQSGHIQIYKRGYSEKGRVNPYSYLITDKQESQIVALVKNIPSVSFITSRLQFSGLISSGDNAISFLGQGIEVQNEKSVPLEYNHDVRAQIRLGLDGLPVISSGEPLDSEDVFDVVLGQGLSETIGAKPGMSVVILTNTVAGSTNAFDVNVKGVFFTAAKEFDDIFLRLPLRTTQRLLNTDSVQSIVIKLQKTEDTDKVIAQLRALFKENKLDMEVKSWLEDADFYKKIVALFNIFFLIMRIIIGTVVVLGIFNTMNMSVMDRISEIGTIMAMGVRRKGVLQLFLLEGFTIGAIGGGLGVIAGVAIVALISAMGIEMPPPPGGTSGWISTPKIVPSAIISTFILSICVGGISALYPAYKASRLQITEAFRYR